MKAKSNSIFTMLPFYIWLALFIVLPLVLLAVYSLKSAGSFSLDNYKKLFEPIYMSVLLRSLKLACFATLACLLFAYPLALILSESKKRQNPVWFFLFIAPMWMNFLIRTLAWRSILDDSGAINMILEALGLNKVTLLGGDGAIISGMVYDLLPYMLFPIYNTVCQIPNHLLEASRDLGAGYFGTLRRIILPMSVPGIVSGITMVFVPSVTTFVFTEFFANGKGMLIGNLIEQQFSRANNWGFGSAVSMLCMAVIVLCMWFVNSGGNDDKGGTSAWQSF